MSETVDRQRAAYQKFFDAINEGTWEEIASVARGLVTQDFILHTVGKPENDCTIDVYLASAKSEFAKYSSQKIAFENCFSVGPLMASHVIFETTDKETNETRKQDLFFVDRYEGDKVAEEWVW